MPGKKHEGKKREAGRSETGHDTRYIKQQKNYCFACGKNNPDGMRLHFTYDEDRDCFVSRFRLGKRYTGPPGHCHGGIIATILDEAMGKVNKLRHVVAVTSEMTVNYLKPVPLKEAAARGIARGEGGGPEAHQYGRDPERKRGSAGAQSRPVHSHRSAQNVRKICGPITPT